MSEVYHHEGKSVYPIIFEVNYGQMKSINCYLFDDGQKLTLIDGGIDLPVFKDFFDAKLKEYGFTYENIDQIILTHHHGDHIGMVNHITKNRVLPVYAHQLALERLYLTEDYQLQKKEFFMKLYDEYGGQHLAKSRFDKMAETFEKTEFLKIKSIVQPLRQGDIIQGLEVTEVPGHSPDSILLYDKETKWLFCGDLVLYTGTSNALVDHDEAGELLPTVVQYKNSLEKCLEFDVAMVFAGHQRPYDNLNEIVEKNLQRIDYKINRIVEKVSEGHRSALQLATAIYGDRVEKEFSLIMSEIIGYLTYAELAGLIIKSWNGQEWTFNEKEIQNMGQ